MIESDNHAIAKGHASIIMPAFNAEKTIETSIKSVLSQTYDALELIIIDDGSRDNTVGLVTEYSVKDSRVRLIKQQNRGAGPARNAGIAAARGDFVAFLDSDDTWDLRFLEKMVRALRASPQAALAYCGWQNVGLPPNRCQPYLPPHYELEGKLKHFLASCPWPIHAALMQREALLAVGGFDERWTSCMDYDLWLRLATFRPIVYVPEVLAFYLHHGGEQITKNRARVALNHWFVQQEFLNQHPETRTMLPADTIKELTVGELKRRAYDSYWKRDTLAARRIFRQLLKSGNLSFVDMKYFILSLLPKPLHEALIKTRN